MTNYNLKPNHRHFLDISSISAQDAREIIEKAKSLKKEASEQNASKSSRIRSEKSLKQDLSFDNEE